MTMHNTIGDEHWVPESEEIDEAFWEETMNKDWSSAVDQGNDQPHLKDARPGINNNGENTASQDVQAALSNSLVPASQVEAPGSSSGENHASLDPLLEDLFGAGDNVVPAQPAVQLEPIQPGAEHFHFSPDPQYDPFAPEDDHVVPTQQILQAEAPQPSDGDNRSSQNPLLDDFFADLVPELTPETLQELGTSLGLSGDFADYQSRLLEQGVPEGNLAPAETATTGSKRKTTDEESSNESKKVRLQEGPTTYTPYQPRQDQRRVPTQQPRPQNHQRLPPYVSSTSAPPLAQGALPNPTATPEKPPTPRSTTLMPPPRRRPPPTNQSSLPPPTPTNARRHGPRSNPSKTPLAQPTSHNPQRHQTLQPYQSHPTPFPASHIVPPKPPTTAPTNTAHPSSSQPTPPSGPHPPQGAPIDHRYTAPTTANQMALIITLLEPTINQFQGLMQGTPFADHIVDTDMAASYMTQHQHIVREMEALWGRMNWDRSALPRLSIVGPISGARWEGR